jgi:sortase A
MAAPEALLRVPKVGLEVPIFEGTSDLVMNRGVGHIAGTALPGETGNVGIAGHRDGFFRSLKDVVPGDVIEIQRRSDSGTRVDRYTISRTEIVFPTDSSVLSTTATPTLTLVTCFPFHYVGAAPQRFVVQATLLPDRAAAARPVQITSGD